jgi:hypothetical protein
MIPEKVIPGPVLMQIKADLPQIAAPEIAGAVKPVRSL